MVPVERGAKDIMAVAQKMLRSGSVSSELAAASGRIGTPIAIRTPDGLLHSWYVPLTIGTHLCSFFQFLPDGTLMRFSSFHHHPDDLERCPAAWDWLDPRRIRERAEARRQPEETSGNPYMTYDTSPDRIVWAVPMTHANGKVRLVYVAGEIVYQPG